MGSTACGRTCVGEGDGLQHHGLLAAQLHQLVPEAEQAQSLVEAGQSHGSTLRLRQPQVLRKHKLLPSAALGAPGHAHQQRFHPAALQQRHLVDQ